MGQTINKIGQYIDPNLSLGQMKINPDLDFYMGILAYMLLLSH